MNLSFERDSFGTDPMTTHRNTVHSHTIWPHATWNRETHKHTSKIPAGQRWLVVNESYLKPLDWKMSAVRMCLPVCVCFFLLSLFLLPLCLCFFTLEFRRMSFISKAHLISGDDAPYVDHHHLWVDWWAMNVSRNGGDGAASRKPTATHSR